MPHNLFESIRHVNEHEQEYWSARELYPILGYTNWNKFQDVILRAREAIRVSGANPDDHFYPEVKMVSTGSGAKRPIEDIRLTRRACYQIAMNGDTKKEPIALAQMYFASQTRKQELMQEYLADKSRLEEREKYSETDKNLSSALYNKWLTSPEIASVKSKWQRVFYATPPDDMRRKYAIPAKKPIVDRAPDILITAQSLANQMTAMNVEKSKWLRDESGISREHMTNNKSIRSTLIERGIVPEDLPPAEDTKKLPKKIQKFEEGLDPENLLSR